MSIFHFRAYRRKVSVVVVREVRVVRVVAEVREVSAVREVTW